MKKHFILMVFFFFLTTSGFAQIINTFSTVDRIYDREEMGLHINWLFPGECLFYWSGVFDASPISYDLYLDSVELAIAFERFDESQANDTLLVDIFKGDTSKTYLERYYSYKIDLGKLGFPEKFSSDPFSLYTDTKPTLKRIRFIDYNKIVKVGPGFFIIGIRMQKVTKRSPWQNYLLPNSGLHIGKIEFDSPKSFKKLSRRYVLYDAGNTSSSKNGKLEAAFPNSNWSIYMRAFTSSTVRNQSIVVNTTEVPTYRCDVISNIDDNKYIEKEFELSQNYPNPFNPSTLIKYEINQQCKVKIDILNLLGQKIKTLIETKQDKGSYTIPFDATGLTAGMYLYRISTFDGNNIIFSETKKMLFIK